MRRQRRAKDVVRACLWFGAALGLLYGCEAESSSRGGGRQPRAGAAGAGGATAGANDAGGSSGMAGSGAFGGSSAAGSGAGGSAGNEGGQGPSGTGPGGADDGGDAGTSGEGGDGGSVCGPLTAPRDCGRCGHDCTALPYVNPEGIGCLDGVCTYGPGACLPGFGHCSTDPAAADLGCTDDLTLITSCGDCSSSCTGGRPFCASPGIETPTCVGACSPLNLALCGNSQCVDLQTHADHCGRCGERCSQNNGYAVCERGGCVGAGCFPGYGDCDGELGCESRLSTFDNCLRCGDSCAAARATSRCEAGACIHECNPGFGNCDPSDPDCETPLDTTENCGACGSACPRDRPICSDGTCVVTCARALCGTACADLMTDVRHCGTCGNACEPYQACEAGRCTPRYLGTGMFEVGNFVQPSVAMHPGGAFVVSQGLNGSADFDPGAGVVERTSRDWDAVITRFDSDGSHAWTHLLGGATTDFHRHAAFAPDGSVLSTLNFSGTADLNPGTGTSSHTATGSMALGVVKLAADGSFVWARSFNASGSEAVVEGSTITVDASGAVYLSGFFSGEIDLDPGSGTVQRSASALETFVVKLTSSGEYAWGLTFANCELYLADAHVDTTPTLWLVGTFLGSCDLDPGTGSAPTTAVSQDAVIVGLDAGSGAYVRNRTSNLTANNGFSSMAGDGAGSLFLSQTSMTQDYRVTSLLVGTDPTLVEQWSRTFEGTSDGFSIARAPGGGIVAVGGSSFGPGPYSQGVLMLGLDGDGAPTWKIDLSAPSAFAVDVASSDTGFVVIGLNSGAPFDADPGPGSTPIGYGIFITRYAF